MPRAFRQMDSATLSQLKLLGGLPETLCGSILEATKTRVAANGFIVGEESWSVSELNANKEKREMLWEEGTFWESGSSEGPRGHCNLPC